MLRNKKTRSLASILSISGFDRNAYELDPKKLSCAVKECPLCHARLWKNGNYVRYLPGDGAHDGTSGIIYRKRCSDCKASFSFHPEFLLPRQSYSLRFVAAWLWAFLGGASFRCRGFLNRNGVTIPAAEQGVSWSDALDWQRTVPGYQLLHRWSQNFCSRARDQLPRLIDSATAAGVVHLSEGREVVERAQPFETVWLHWEAMWRMKSTTATIDTEEAFRQLVRRLARKPLSHNVRRDGSPEYLYDVLIR